MAKRKVWVTWMPDEASGLPPNDTLATLARYGIEPTGAPWVDNLEKMAWTELAGQLLDPASADGWLVAGRRADLESVNNRYAVSLLAAMLREGREQPLATWFLGLDFVPFSQDVPMLLQGFQFADGTNKSWPAKLVAALAGRKSMPVLDFRFNVIAHPLLGQWFEIGPREGEWRGAIFGANGDAKITHQAVGPAGQLPEKTVLEYPTEGIQAKVGESDYIAWSVQNRITPAESYYAKVEGHPARLLVGENPAADDAEVSVVNLT